MAIVGTRMLVVAPFILVHISILMLSPIECHDERERERDSSIEHQNLDPPIGLWMIHLEYLKLISHKHVCIHLIVDHPQWHTSMAQFQFSTIVCNEVLFLLGCPRINSKLCHKFLF